MNFIKIIGFKSRASEILNTKRKLSLEIIRKIIDNYLSHYGTNFHSFFSYHLIIALAQVNPLPKAANTSVSPSFILPNSQASVSAIGIDAAVVFPYF